MYYDGYITAQNADDAYDMLKDIDFSELSYNELKMLDITITDNGDSAYVEDEDEDETKIKEQAPLT